MRKLFSISLCFVVIVAFIGGLSFLNPTSSKNIFSPLPSLLTKTFSNPRETVEFWLPNVEVARSVQKEVPEILAQSALTYDLTTNTMLYKKNISKRLPIASLTKIMTAIVAVENGKPDVLMTVDAGSAAIGEDSMGLSEGETLAMEELLYGLFLHSGNDAAEVLARRSQFGRDNFVYLMNKRSEELGLTNTHFTNPSGLEGDGKQYSTAYDLLVITRYALKYPVIAKVAATYDHYIPYTSNHKEFQLYNETNLLTSYPGVKGVKTGFTDEAGRCLVTYLDYGGHKIIGVLLNSENRRQEMKDLLDYSLKTLGVVPPSHE